MLFEYISTIIAGLGTLYEPLILWMLQRSVLHAIVNAFKGTVKL